MNEHHNDYPLPKDLPHPEHRPIKGEAQDVHSSYEAAQSAAIEAATSGGGRPLSQTGNQPAASTPGVAIPTGPASFVTQHAQGTPAVADDLDLIEPEWVDKAKEIVERTKDNPFAQSNEMNKVKADYLKKRYNKELKLTEDS